LGKSLQYRQTTHKCYSYGATESCDDRESILWARMTQYEAVRMGRMIECINSPTSVFKQPECFSFEAPTDLKLNVSCLYEVSHVNNLQGSATAEKDSDSDYEQYDDVTVTCELMDTQIERCDNMEGCDDAAL
jgi:hypothetical protein